MRTFIVRVPAFADRKSLVCGSVCNALSITDSKRTIADASFAY